MVEYRVEERERLIRNNVFLYPESERPGKMGNSWTQVDSDGQTFVVDQEEPGTDDKKEQRVSQTTEMNIHFRPILSPNIKAPILNNPRLLTARDI